MAIHCMGHSTDISATLCFILIATVSLGLCSCLFSLHLSSDGHHLPSWRGFHGDHTPFWVDCWHGIRVANALQDQRVRLAGWVGRGLAKDNNSRTGSLQQDVGQLFLCRVDHRHTIHLHQSTSSITHTQQQQM